MIPWFIDKSKEDQKIIAEISLLKEEQSEISMVKEFAKHAKLQRKINKLNEQLKNNSMLLLLKVNIILIKLIFFQLEQMQLKI